MCRLIKFIVSVLVLAFCFSANAQPVAPRKEFPPGSIRLLQDLPAGPFRTQLERLPAPARERALAWLGNLHLSHLDFDSLQVDPSGGIFYADQFTFDPPPASPAETTSAAAVPISPFPERLIFHSKPGAPNVLYLNFVGMSVTNTAWNNSLARTVIPALPFSIDSDRTTFSDAEQLAIKRIWQRVAEDYAPFNIDVTTERPTSFNSRTAVALITRSTDANGDPNPASTSGGVAYIGVFGSSLYATYRPAWVYHDNLGNDDSYIAEATSHEIGHNLGLSHDGKTDGAEYYGGHGFGETSWGPIMGTGYNRNLSQWCKGEYHLANNTQDDLAAIAGKLSYRTDDHGNTWSSATPLRVSNAGLITATTPDNDPSNTLPDNKGILERTTDVDFFSFAAGTGPVNLTILPWSVPGATFRGGNLDLLVELYDSTGRLLLTNNPPSTTSAFIQTNLLDGVYFLAIRNTGAGSPTSNPPSGYTPYGSLGQYFISGSVVPSGVVIPPGAELVIKDLTQPATGPHLFEVVYTDNAGINTATLDHNDLSVIGPTGLLLPVSFLRVSDTSNGSPRTATYSIEPPGSIWNLTHNGLYTVVINPDQVIDIEGVAVPSRVLGSFTVAIPRSIYFEPLNTHPGWILQPSWQYGPPRYTSGGPTSGFTGSNIVGYNLSGNYENRLQPTFATTLPINCTGAANLTLRFKRWLRLRNGDTALIQLSTNALTWVDLWHTTKTVTDNSWQDVQYSLPSWTFGSPSLQIRWGIASGPSQNDIGWNLDDISILGDSNLDTEPPTPLLNAPNLTFDGSPFHLLSVSYSDNVALQVASIDSADLFVVSPSGLTNTVEFVGLDVPDDGTPRTATYSFPAPGGSWTPDDNGTYQVYLQENQVCDTSGNYTEESLLGSFTVAITTSRQALVIDPNHLVIEEGKTASFTIRLAEEPSAEVLVSVAHASGDPDIRVVSSDTLTFTPDNWSTPVEVLLTALPDADDEVGTATIECRSDGLPSVFVLVNEKEAPLPEATLSLTINNPEWGSVLPASGTYPMGTALQLTALPQSFYQFIRWEGSINSTNNPLSLVLTNDLVLHAIFQEKTTPLYAVPYTWLAAHGFRASEEVETLLGENGVPLWQSFVAGLDPRDPGSQLILDISPTELPGSWFLGWPALPGRIYTLLTSTNPATGFIPVPLAESSTSIGQIVLTITNGSPETLFFRLEVRKP